MTKVSSKNYVKQYFNDHLYFLTSYLAPAIRNRTLRVLSLASLQKGFLILDSGCGIGTITMECAKKGFFTVGVDFSKAAVKIAKKMSHKLNVADNCEIICADVQNLPFLPITFNTILAADLVEHLYQEQYKNALEEWFRVLKSRGNIIIHTDNPSFFVHTQWPLFKKISKITSLFLRARNKRLLEHQRRFGSVHVELKSLTYLSTTLRIANYVVLSYNYFFNTILSPRARDVYLIKKLYNLMKAIPIIGKFIELFFCSHITIVGSRP